MHFEQSRFRWLPPYVASPCRGQVQCPVPSFSISSPFQVSSVVAFPHSHPLLRPSPCHRPAPISFSCLALKLECQLSSSFSSSFSLHHHHHLPPLPDRHQCRRQQHHHHHHPFLQLNSSSFSVLFPFSSLASYRHLLPHCYRHHPSLHHFYSLSSSSLPSFHLRYLHLSP